MHDPTPTPTTALDPASPASASSDPARADEIRRQLRGLALALFAWTAQPPDPAASTASERMLARVLAPLLPRLRDALLARLSSADPAALEAIVGASASALESMLYYAPGEPLPRYAFRWTTDAEGAPRVELVPAAALRADA
jgi:hypothetical protein